MNNMIKKCNLKTFGRCSRSGVTLIELLLSIAILGVITGVISMVLNVGVESWRTGTSMADGAHHADAVMEQVVMAIKSAYYPEAKEPTYEYGFQHADGGESPEAEDRISWVKIGNSLIGEDVPWAGSAHRVELFLDDVEDSDDTGLYVKAWQLVGQTEDFDPEEDVVPLLLSDHVISFDCQIVDPDYKVTIGEPYEWIEEWTQSNRIPTTVKISIAIKPQYDGSDPVEYSRVFDIPMAEMSWDLIEVSNADDDDDRDNKYPNKGNNTHPNTNNNNGRPNNSGNGGFGIDSVRNRGNSFNINSTRGVR